MRLPSFATFAPLVNLKTKMGIPREKLGSLRSIVIEPYKVSSTEKQKLAQNGLEVGIEEVGILDDGTLIFKDQRVLLYIRDVANYGNRTSNPRFHFSNCATLRDMRQNNRFGKYVIVNRSDGLFALNFVGTGRHVVTALNVCQNCLDYLGYDGFRLGQPYPQRKAAVGRFSCDEFFSRYPKNLHHQNAAHSAKTAPLNDYSSDWSAISKSFRIKAKWRCAECCIDLSAPDLQRFLQVHHINGLKSENDERNLRALCVRCHAKEADHSHVRFTRQYKEFIDRF